MRSLAALLCVLAALSLPAARSSAQVATVTRTGHLTKIGAATGCNGTGTLVGIYVVGHVQPGHRFTRVRAFHLHLTDGRTITIAPRAPYEGGPRTAVWRVFDASGMRISPRLRLSWTRYTATRGSVFTATAHKWCYSM